MKDLEILRELAREYAVYALDGRSAARKESFRAQNALEIHRPPVLVFEVPWGEYDDNPELILKTQDPRARAMETELRRAIFQFKYFEGDYALHDYYRVPVVLHNSGNGLVSSENIIEATTGTDIVAHQYLDIIPDAETFLSKIKTPVITYDKEATAERLSFADEVFHGIMPVKKAGVGLYLASWDQIPRFHGIENSLMDLYDDPDYAHLLISRFTDNHIAVMKQYEELNVLDTDPLYLHCTPAATRELPVKDMDKDDITLKDVWARAMAQIFAVVSPEMHDEFDLQYSQKLFDLCGLSYYGCCEPLHGKIEQLKRFKNLRRISITAWADVDIAAEKIGSNYILSYKPNPAFVALPDFDPAPVEAEIRHVLEACKRNGTPCEFILKDISTTASNYTNLTKWVETANRVIDEYFPR
ncbi:MAG: hypothetical protein IKM13_05075 [Clostridia bacterium]|nr:hypothetical protein [Clostridia bacterium]